MTPPFIYATALNSKPAVAFNARSGCRDCVAGHAEENKAHGRILVGTASWTDPGFVAHWYPKGMPAAARLAWYAEQFELVEVNSSFYAVPDPRTVERWCRGTPDGFVFDLKLHQLLSRHSHAREVVAPEVTTACGN